MNSVVQKNHNRPITVLIAALGGEGGGVLAEWLVNLATVAGYHAQGTSIPGVAQRTGATSYYVEIYPVPVAELNGKRPVLSLNPVPGGVDLFVSSELLESSRHMQTGVVSPERTFTITSTHRTLTTGERMALGDGRADSAELLEVIRKLSQTCVAFDMQAATRSAGTAPSAVMFGAMAASGRLPFERAQWEEVIRRSGRGVDASLRGFALAWDQTIAGGTEVDGPRPAAPTPARSVVGFPDEVQDLLVPGLERVEEFQDAAYGKLYLERLTKVLNAERAADPQAANAYALTREAARFLALWMAFDDIVRVARLKCSASRFERVRKEVRASEDDVLHIVDLFKPGIPEVAGLLPKSLGQRLLAWEARRRAAGKSPMEFPLHLRTTGVFGFLMLRVAAGMRGMRRRGARFGEEQEMIERWLERIVAGAGESWALGYEIVLCGRLIKGYGSTNERGKANLLHILDHLATVDSPLEQKLANIRRAREAALADEAGRELDQVLVGSGAPPRPVKPQPVIWHPAKVRQS